MKAIPALLLLLLLAGALPPGTARAGDPRADRLLSPTWPGRETLLQAWRAGSLDRSDGNLFPRDAGEVEALADSPRAAAARPWLPAALPARGLRLAVDATLLAFAADPPVQTEPLFLDLRRGEAVDPAWRLRAGVWADAGLAEDLSAHLRFVVDTEGRNHPWNRTPDFRQLGASNNLDEAYLRYTPGAASFVLGRRFLFWGPEGFLLADGAPALDLLQAELDLGPHRLGAFVGRLSTSPGTRTVPLADALPDGTDHLVEKVELQRTVYGHRLDLSLGSFGRLGLSELALLARPQGGLDLKYLNPVGIHAVAQTEDDGGDSGRVNIFHQVDAELWWRAWHLHGAVLVDDLQIDGGHRRRWPDQLAFSAGADRRLGGPLAPLLSYRYRRIGSWTYLHRGDGLTLEHYGRPLGAVEGPDMDRHLLRLDLRPSPRWALWTSVERRRRGENRLDTDESREGHAGEAYPRGRVERRWILEAGMLWQRPPGLRLRVALRWQGITDPDNEPGDESIAEVRAAAEIYGPALSWLLP